jgi:HTH-type transcriptional regulator / antitoxin HigA
MVQDFGKMTLTINEKVYADLLSIAKPRIITTEVENQQVLSQVEKLMAIIDRTPEQDELLDLLVVLVEKFEDEYYPINDASPHDILLHLMEENNLKQADLVGILGSRGVISEVVNGKRQISKNQAKALSNFFHVDVGLFI